MVKLIPFSIVLVSIFVPILLAAKPRPKQTVRRLQITIAVLALLWAILCLKVYPRYVFPE